MKKFNKPQTSISDHIKRLKNRGMNVPNEQMASDHLTHIGYYRLCSYWLPYQIDQQSHTFVKGTNFNDIIRDYNFDRELRLLILDAIERLEISLKTKWVYEFIDTHDNPHAHLNESLFKRSKKWNHIQGIQDLEKEKKRSHEIWVKHFSKTYEERLPPLWACCELMTLGCFSKWFANTKLTAIKNKTARAYGIDETILTSFLHHLAIVRNMCAHHSRVWNRNITFTFKIPKYPQRLASGMNEAQNRRIYNTLVMLASMMRIVNPETKWNKRIIALIKKYDIDLQPMGFPEDYLDRKVWQDG